MSDDAAKTTTAATAAPTMSDDAKTTVGTAPTRGRQLRVMLDKLWLVRKRSVGQNIQLYVIPIMSLIVMYLFYGAFQAGNNKWKSSGILELVFLPVALLFLLISGAVTLVAEKAARLVETMKIMSLKMDVYYLSYFIEGVFSGLLLALILASISVAMGLFNDGSWQLIFGLILIYSVLTVCLSFWIASFMDIPQGASMFALAFVAVCIIIFFTIPDLVDAKHDKLSRGAQTAWCLLPPMALQFGINSFRGPPTADKYTRPQPRKRRLGIGCDRFSDVYLSFNCDGQGRSNNLELPTPVPQWTEDTNTSDLLSGYQVFGMLPRHTYLPNEITCGDNGGSRDYDYNNLPGGECVSDGSIGTCTTIPDGDDAFAQCPTKCDETTPGWIAINLYGTEDAAGIDCCCQTSCDCSQPSTNGIGWVITQNVANLPTSFCPDGRVVTSGTCKRRRKYTQYDGIRLGDILGMMVVDMIIFSLLAYYFSQVWPSEFGVRKHWCFCLPCLRGGGAKAEDEPGDRDVEDREGASGDEVIVERDHRTDAPTVTIKGLRKVFGSFVAVDDLGFDMHANEIFSLLGHNGAGKTTSINVLTGILASDSREADGGATIFGHPIKTDLDGARSVIGVCPQHNVLFELLTTREHLTFFARLKGSTDADAEEEADQLLEQFHLSERGNHQGHELSGGMKRKLSTAVALCGRSKFVLLDEPTAGMDALARRELWDLLAGAKKDRTILLTTHYMDEADVLGDRIGIMSHGKLRCVGCSRFLKAHYGAGYRVVCEKAADFDEQASLRGFDDLLKEKMPGGERAETLAKRKIAEPTFEATLPLDARDKFGDFFHALDERKDGLKIAGYGLTITTLEEVFLAVGGDETVAPKEIEGELAIGAGRKYQASFPVQVMGLAKKRLHIAPNDCKTILLILFPLVGCVAGFALAINNTLSSKNENQDLGTFSIACIAGTLLVPPLLAENVVRERETKLRDILAVMGCDFRAYWLGTFLGDSILLAIAWVLGYWIFVPATGVSRYLNNAGTFWWPPLCISYIIIYSYAMSLLFSKSKRCLIFGTGLQILQLYIGLFIVLILYLAGAGIGESKLQGRQYWVSPAFSPQTMFFMGMYAVVRKPGANGGPRYVWQVILYLAVFAAFYIFIIYSRELVHERPLAVVMPDADVAATAEGDDDVKKEREAVNAMTDIPPGGPYTLVAHCVEIKFRGTWGSRREILCEALCTHSLFDYFHTGRQAPPEGLPAEGFQEGRDRRRARLLVPGREGRVLRSAGSERRGQDYDHGHDHPGAAADGGRRLCRRPLDADRFP